MKVIYIAGAFRGANAWEIHQNVLRAEEITAKLIGQGYAVICSHKMTENMQGLYDDQIYLDACMELIKRCDAIYMLKGWEDSEGSKEELSLALKEGKEVYYED